MYNRGADIESANGDIYLSAGTLLFDTVELYNRTVRKSSSSGFLSKKTKITIDESLTNIGSKLTAGGNVQISTTGDASFRGSTVEAGGSALFNIGGNLTVTAAHDSVSHYSKTSKSSWGGLVKEINILKTGQTMLNGSVVNTLDGLNIISGQNTNIIGSDISAGGDLGIFAGYRLTENGLEKSGLSGSLNVINDFEEVKSYSYHEKTDMRKAALNAGALVFGSAMPTYLVGSLLAGDIDIGYDRGRVTAGIEIGKSESTENTVYQKNVVGSTLSAGGNLTLGAANDIYIVGSDLISGGDISLDAVNINIRDAKNTQNTNSVHEETTINFSASAGNAFVDAGYAAADVYDAGKEVHEATQELNRIRKLHEQGEASEAALLEAKLNLDMAMADFANANLGVTQAAVAGVTSIPTLGFYGNAGHSMETTTTKHSSSSSESVGSNILASGNITFNAANNMTQLGSNVYSEQGDILYKVGQNLNISAAASTYSSNSKQDTYTASYSLGTNGVGGVNGGVSDGKSSNAASVWSNSTVTAENGNISFDVGGNFVAEGINATARNIEAQVGGDFTLASKQNTSGSSSSGGGINAGLSTTGTVSGGVSTSDADYDRVWTDSSSSLIATGEGTAGKEALEISVGGALHMSGSLIANIVDGKDNGSLSITAREITWTDLHNSERSKASGFGISTSYSPQDDGQLVAGSGVRDSRGKFTSDSTTISLQNEKSKTTGQTLATIGLGSINTGTDISGLNRSVASMNLVEEEKILHALDGSFTLNHMWVTDTERAALGAWTSVNNLVGAGAVATGLVVDLFQDGDIDMAYKYDSKNHAYHVVNSPLNNGGAITFGNIINYFGGDNQNTEYHNNVPQKLYELGYDANLGYIPATQRNAALDNNELLSYIPGAGYIIKDGAKLGSQYTNLPNILGTHEVVHVEQYERLGPFYLFVYLLNGGVSESNKMEIEADLKGYEAYRNKYSGSNNGIAFEFFDKQYHNYKLSITNK